MSLKMSWQFLFLLVAISYVEKPIIYSGDHPCNHWDWYQGNYICIDNFTVTNSVACISAHCPMPTRTKLHIESGMLWTGFGRLLNSTS